MVLNQNTTVTTRTTEQGSNLGTAPGTAKVLNKDAVVTSVTEKPVLENVIEKKNVEIHHKPVVQEIHEQKIIEIEKQPLVQHVQQQGLVQQQQRLPTQFEQIGTGQLGEQERLRLQQFQTAQAPKVVHEQGTVKEFQEKPAIAQVIKQDVIERHVQPVVTEVREQNVVQQVVQPIVRKIYDAPVVREVAPQTGASFTQQRPLQTNAGFSQSQTTIQQQNFQNQGGLQQGLTSTKTTTTGMTGTTTVTSGGSALATERQNMLQHEQKLVNKEAPLSTAQQQNLAVHEKVVDQVTKGQQLGTRTNQPLQQGRTYTDAHEEKPGFLTRVKDKLHLGGHHDSATKM